MEEVRIYRNYELIEARAVQSSKVLGKVLRFNKALPIAGIDDDSFLHVEAGMRLDFDGNPLSPGLPSTDYLGLSVALLSYNGAFHIGLNADYDLVSDLSEFSTLVEESLDELVRAASRRTA